MGAVDTSEPKVRAAATLDPVVLAELIRLAMRLRTATPDDLASTEMLKSRKEFLRESIGDSAETDTAFERIIGGDELQPIAYLERGMIAARAVARVKLSPKSSGTGFLIAPRVLLTNNHVLPNKATATDAIAQFRYETDLNDNELTPIEYEFRPDELFFTLPKLDYTVVAVEPISQSGAVPLSGFGSLPLIETTGKVTEGEWLTVIQHPEGARKQICVRENQFLKRNQDFIWYSTDTKQGSSGSPVFNNDWYVVALHHAGVPAKDGGQIQRNPDGTEKWFANEGVRVSRIVETLKQALPKHPLLMQMYTATPASARITYVPTLPRKIDPTPKEIVMTESRTVTVPLEVKLLIQPDGRVEAVSTTGGRSTESFGSDAATFLEKKTKPAARFDAPFDDDYSKRGGFNPAFLGSKAANRVALPVLNDALEAVVAPLIKPKDGNKYVLHYHNFSVVMHKTRRLPIYSAANVSFAHRFEMSRPSDVWRRDPRILAEYQLENWYYASNKFDRGHMTRREDLEFGASPKAALASAADTCHWANCVPQHAKFNQNKEIWQGIERYVLEESIREGEVDAQIITGPILDEGDPEYRKVKYPLQFWKVVAAINSKGALFATAYIAGQEEVIAQFGIEVTEVPFGAYKTFQTKISEIERLTGLTFMCGPNDKTRLSTADPLEKPLAAGRRRKRRTQESTGPALPENYIEITDLDDIEL